MHWFSDRRIPVFIPQSTEQYHYFFSKIIIAPFQMVHQMINIYFNIYFRDQNSKVFEFALDVSDGRCPAVGDHGCGSGSYSGFMAIIFISFTFSNSIISLMPSILIRSVSVMALQIIKNGAQNAIKISWNQLKSIDWSDKRTCSGIEIVFDSFTRSVFTTLVRLSTAEVGFLKTSTCIHGLRYYPCTISVRPHDKRHLSYQKNKMSVARTRVVQEVLNPPSNF